MIYKEWIKTRLAVIGILLLTNGFAAYAMMRLHNAIGLMGAPHIWQAMLEHEAEPTFVAILQYVPLVCGIILACAQFCPEMYHKCLKLTLHLPCSHFSMMMQMLGYGCLTLLVCYALNFAIMWGYMSQVIAPELYSRLLMACLPWYMAGLASYLLTAWIILEGSWSRRLLDGVVAVLCLKVFMMSSYPCAYLPALPWLIVFCVGCLLLPWISIDRFKKGAE